MLQIQQLKKCLLKSWLLFYVGQQIMALGPGLQYVWYTNESATAKEKSASPFIRVYLLQITSWLCVSTSLSVFGTSSGLKF
jgi:low temperature requirement protein LtrA